MSCKRIYNVNINRIPTSELKYSSVIDNHISKHKDTLPSVIDLRSKCPIVFDQGQLGSCTANAICSAFQVQDTADDGIDFVPSRLFVYYNERSMEKTVSEDSGALISDGIKSLKKYGVCPESSWSYDITKFTVKPPQSCYTSALTHKAISVSNIRQDMISMKASLFSGYPFVVGISVYSSFESDDVAKTGIVPMPDITKEQLLGGHAILCVGYDDTKNVWIMRNSWGTGWGMSGYFTLPYDYLLSSQLSSDLWNITKVSPSSGKKNLQLSTKLQSLQKIQEHIDGLKYTLNTLMKSISDDIDDLVEEEHCN